MIGFNFDKQCVKCRHCVEENSSKSGGGKSYVCWRPVDVVSGRIVPTRCITMRSRDGECGPQGRWFKQIEGPEPINEVYHNINSKPKKIKETA